MKKNLLIGGLLVIGAVVASVALFAVRANYLTQPKEKVQEQVEAVITPSEVTVATVSATIPVTPTKKAGKVK